MTVRDEEIYAGVFRVIYNPDCTVFVDFESEKFSLDEVAVFLRGNFPSTSIVIVRNNLGGKYVEVDWSEKQFEWKNHRRELQRRVINPLKNLSRK